jgi:hypothetical protein
MRLTIVCAAWFVAGFAGAAACTPPATSGPVVPVDASDASPCSIADALTAGRMIALPDGGVLQVPCGP